MITSVRTIALALAALACTSGAALAAGSAKHAEGPPGGFSFEQPFGTFDRGALQRGFQVYKEVCASCHGMAHLSYRNLGEPNGPFAAVAPRDWQETGVTPELNHSPGHGKYYVDPNLNPYVREIASQYEITEIDPQTGEEITRPARPADQFRYPFPNEATARAANGGAYPPELSVIAKARHGGADYLYNLLLGYKEPPPGVQPVAGRYYNEYFKGGWIAMSPQLVEGRVDYADGTQATPEQMAKDVATFLAWASDPKAELRKETGLMAMGYLGVLTLLLFVAYRQVWRNEHH